ncbi:hypothetical protein FA702_20225 (plasmid) [Novosphingobium sp. EMRT-2]|nr:hypothetical protein FA702_20225 [Novosphingobium sp. EMRT-2]
MPCRSRHRPCRRLPPPPRSPRRRRRLPRRPPPRRVWPSPGIRKRRCGKSRGIPATARAPMLRAPTATCSANCSGCRARR